MNNKTVVFSLEWFKEHQGVLLWFLNNWITKRWFRWVLRILKDVDLSLKTVITEITPNSFSWGDNYFIKNKKLYVERTTDFRTHNKFAKRLYFAFRPLWWLLHFWDWIIADRFAFLTPYLSFNFATLTVYPEPSGGSHSYDGYLGYEPGTWATVRGAASALQVVEFNTEGRMATAFIYGSYYGIYRSNFGFYIASIGSNATITSAILSFAYYGDEALQGTTGVVGCTVSNNASITASDYSGSTLNSPTEFCTRFTPPSAGSYKNNTLNASGISFVDTNKTGTANFMTREAHDIDNSVPTNWYGGKWYYADATGVSTDPKLVVTYTKETILQAKARIKVLSNDKTSQAKARILVVQSQTIQTKAMILGAGQKTIQAKGRIYKLGIPQTATAKARIKITDNEESTQARARILKVQEKTTQAKACLKNTVSKTAQTKARIASNSVTKSIQTKARIKKNQSATIAAKSYIKGTQAKTTQAKAKLWAARLGVTHGRRSEATVRKGTRMVKSG